MLKWTLLFILVLFSFYQLSVANFAETVYTVSLTPNQVVDSPVIHDNANSYGIGYCKLDRYLETPDLHCVLQHNVQEIVEISINFASRGVIGEPVYFFTLRQGYHVDQVLLLEDIVVFENVTYYSYENKTEVVKSTVVSNYTVGQQINDFLDGLWYLQIITTDFPQGEIRGQIEHRDRFYSPLLSQNTIPRSSGSQAHGVSVGSFSSTNKQELSLAVIQDVTLAISTDIYAGAEGEAGNYLASSSPYSPSFPIFTLTIAESAYLYQDLIYLNIASQSNPLGDIRGQLLTIDYVSNPAFTAFLDGDGANSDSTALGNGIFSYDCSSRLLEYLIIHTVENATAAFMNLGVYSSVDSIGFVLSSGTSPIYGSRILTESEASALLGGLYFVAIYTEVNSNGSGDIRGQVVNNDYKHYAYLSGTNVLPPVTTKDVGILLMRINEDASTLDYQLVHTASSASLITLYYGSSFDNNGQKLLNLPSAQSPTSFSLTVSNNFIDAVKQGKVYAIVYTPTYPIFGALRGQIRDLLECDKQVSIVTYPETYSLQSSEIDFLVSTENVVYVYLNGASTLSFSFTFFVVTFAMMICFVF